MYFLSILFRSLTLNTHKWHLTSLLKFHYIIQCKWGASERYDIIILIGSEKVVMGQEVSILRLSFLIGTVTWVTLLRYFRIWIMCFFLRNVEIARVDHTISSIIIRKIKIQVSIKSESGNCRIIAATVSKNRSKYAAPMRNWRRITALGYLTLCRNCSMCRSWIVIIHVLVLIKLREESDWLLLHRICCCSLPFNFKINLRFS